MTFDIRYFLAALPAYRTLDSLLATELKPNSGISASDVLPYLMSQQTRLTPSSMDRRSLANGYQIMAHRAQRMTVLLRQFCSAGRLWWWSIPLVLALLIAGGCGPHDEPELVFGQRGTQPGDMVRPRAVAIDAQDRIYIVDFTARIQVFDRDGQFLNIGWTTPDYRNGRPSGLSIDRDNNLIVSDSHYHCFRICSHDGKELRKIGGEAGTSPGQLGYISDVVQDEDGYYYVAEFCENQRITKLDKDGKFIKFWGSAGTEPGQFGRIRALALGPDKHLYVVDATNHRIEVFTRDGELVDCWGEPGSEPGKLSYPHDLAFGKHGELYVVERGNHRVQKFTTKGQSLGCWGGPGREPGRFHEPWALAVDSHGKVFVIDTENHRVQRISF